MSASKVVMKILSVCITVLIVVLLLFGLIRLGAGAYDMSYRIFTEQPVEEAPGTDVVVEITKGMNAFSIGSLLEEKRLVDNGHLFAIQMQLSAYAKKVRPGLYTLNTSMTAREMLKLMSTVPEEEDES